MSIETIGRYEVQSEIGRGGMATVYLAHDPNFRRNVAIKLVSVSLRDEKIFRERFEREAHLIARIEHPAIVPVYDFGERDHQPYLVMRYMPGGALVNKIRAGALSLSEASRIISQIAPGLDAVHAQGIVHRDLKPANILFDAFGNPAISDFGIAHLTQATSDLTGSAVIGTPAYMSPEQVRSDPDLDGRSDIYALGIILFEMLSGRGPFRGATPISVALSHLTDPVPSILSFRADLPFEVDQILQKALAKSREQRYATASELAQELREVTASLTHADRPVKRRVKPADRRELATEIDTGEESHPSLPAADSQPAMATGSPRTSGTLTRPRQSPITRLLGGTVGLGLGLCLIVLCGAIGLVWAWPKLGLGGSPTQQSQIPGPSATATNVVDIQEVVLLFDDFSNPSSGWPTILNSSGGYSYQSDGYHIVVRQAEQILWAKTIAPYSDSSLYVEARPFLAGTNGYFGLLCRIQDDENFYYFVIRNSGEYTIGKYKNAEFDSLLEGWRQSNAIRTDMQNNRIQADCAASTLRLSVNDVLLAEVTDTDFTSGHAGLVMASLDSQNFEVLFNNFLITEPNQ